MSGRRWGEDEIGLLREFYPDVPTAVLATELRRTASAVYVMAQVLGLKKSDVYLRSEASGRTNGSQGGATRYQKGHATWNKGMKGLQIGGKATQFKRGNKPQTWVPVGSIRITRDGTLQRKINDLPGPNHVRWRGVHELVWIEANGPVPAGHIVVFKPGTRTTKPEEITLDRVECISLAENMRRNTLHRYPKEIVRAVQMRGALNRRINRAG